jgi:hypothetical protein
MRGFGRMTHNLTGRIPERGAFQILRLRGQRSREAAIKNGFQLRRLIDEHEPVAA